MGDSQWPLKTATIIYLFNAIINILHKLPGQQISRWKTIVPGFRIMFNSTLHYA